MSALPNPDRAERVRQVVLLLKHRDEYLQGSQRLAQSFPSKPGPAPGAEVACGCGTLRTREGRIEWVAGSSFCPLCKGTGFRARLRKLDGEATHDERGAVYDPMVYGHDRSAKAGSAGGLRVMDAKETEHELARLRRDERARAGVVTNEAYAWERARERRDKSGSFRELDAALEALRNHNPIVRAMLDNVFSGEVYGPAGTVTDGRYGGRIPRGAGHAFWEALYFLEERMPAVIRLPQAVREVETVKVQQVNVVAVYAETKSLPKTAFRLGMRKSRAKELLQRAGVLPR